MFTFLLVFKRFGSVVKGLLHRSFRTGAGDLEL